MLKEYKMEAKFEEIVDWYDGYSFGETEIFNPWSILNCVDRGGELEQYWVNTGNTNLVDIMAESINADVAEAIGKLVKGETVTVELNEKSVYAELKGELGKFLNTLMFTGYLTVENQYMIEEQKYGVLRIPNKEIREILVNMQRKWLPELYNTDKVLKVCRAIVEQDDKLLEAMMNTLLMEETSYFSRYEEFFKGFFICAMLNLSKEYIRYTERETGYGRADYEIYKADKSMGMIFEFKSCTQDSELDEKVEEGIHQVYQKQYYTRMQNEGVKDIYIYIFNGIL